MIIFTKSSLVRENKFVSEPVLPFASLAMPHFTETSGDSGEYRDIDDNQFSCSCLKLGWLLALFKYGYNSHSLSMIGEGRRGVGESGSEAFLHQLVTRSGPCLHCDTDQCISSSDTSLLTYSHTALTVEESVGVKCADTGVVIRNYDQTPDQEEDINMMETEDRNDINTVKMESESNERIVRVKTSDSSRIYTGPSLSIVIFFLSTCNFF